MTTFERKETCVNCGCDRSNDGLETCPICGLKGRIIDFKVGEGVGARNKLSSETIRTFYEKNLWLLMLIGPISLFGPFLGVVLMGWCGVFVGVALGIISFVVSPWAVTKVREIVKSK